MTPLIDADLPVQRLMGWDPEDYGAPVYLFICKQCVVEMGDLMGMASAEKWEETSARVAELERLLTDAEERAREASQTLEALYGLAPKDSVDKKVVRSAVRELADDLDQMGAPDEVVETARRASGLSGAAASLRKGEAGVDKREKPKRKRKAKAKTGASA